MAIIASVEYYNDGTSSKKIEIGKNLRFPFVINAAGERAEIKCSRVAVVNGEEFEESDPFILRVSNNFQVPIFNADMTPNTSPQDVPNPDFNPELPEDPVTNPSTISEEVQNTIGEWDLWKMTYWENPSPISMQESIENAIKRTLTREEGVVFDPAPPVLAYVLP